jgi:putative peptidoglycan lipid II flippase
VSAVSFARNFQSVPVSLIGVSFSLAIFPTLSAAWAAGDRSGYVAALRTNVLTIAVLTVGAAAGLFLVGGLAIRILLGGGAFDAEDVALTTLVLSVFALSVPFDALSHPLSRGIYATHNTIYPVLASVLALVVTVGTAGWLAPQVGIVAIPLGFTAGAAAKVVALLIGLGLRLRATRAPALA